MRMPIVFKGVIHGTTITLDENALLPDGYRTTWHVLLERGEGVRLAAAGLVELTPEEIAKYEQTMYDLDWPFKFPESCVHPDRLPATYTPLVLKGVVHGTTLTLDEKTFFPDGYRVMLDLILQPGEGLHLLAVGPGLELSPEAIAAYEEVMTELYGRPIKVDDPDNE
jgi:hypothetical protein